MRKVNIRDLVQTAILGAMAYVLMLWRFPLPFMPPFMDFDFAAIPELVGAYIMGPTAGITIIGIKLLLKLVTTGTGSAFTGEIQNFILSSALILTSVLIYRRTRTRKAALLGMIAGTLISSIVAVFSNMYLIIPFFVKAYGLSMEIIINMAQAVNKYVDSEMKFILLGIIPFNLIKGSASTAVLYITYPALMRIPGREGRS